MAAEDLARVTVIAPTRRVDLALPGTATLGDLLPTIVRHAGIEGATPRDPVRGWVLQRVGDDPLDPYRRVDELDLRDGESLHLRRREEELPRAAYDDVVDAVATSLGARPAWRPPDSRTFALAVMAVLAVALPAYALLTRPGPWAALGVLGLSVATGFAAIVLSRAFQFTVVAGVLAWVTAALAGIGGSCVIVSTPRPGEATIQVLTAAAFVLVAAGAMALWARVASYHLLGLALTAAWVLVTAMVVALVPRWAAQMSAVGLTVALAITPLLPTLSFRLAQVAMPNLPASADALMADRQPVQSDIEHRAVTADRYLAAMVTASAAAALLLALPVALLAQGWAPKALLTCAGVAMLLRARAFTGRTQRFVLLTAGTLVSLLALHRWLLGMQAGGLRTLLAIGVVVVALWLLTQYAAIGYDRVLSPVWGRWGDIVEWIAIIALVPFTLAVLDVYSWAYGLAG